jgi:flagellar biosynthesis repressor protein FlbT
MQITLKPGEKIYLNGAVIRVDRKVSIELMNDVTFLLESHVLQVEDTTTPLRQLYYVVQTMLIEPRNAKAARALFDRQLAALNASFRNEGVVSVLQQVGTLVEADRLFDALRTIRRLFPIESAILGEAREPSCAA